jgi:hypothetical protein
MKRKALFFVVLVILVFAQLTALYSFFYPVQTFGGTYGADSIVEIAKFAYVYGTATVTVTAPLGIATLTNGTQITLNPVIQFPNGSLVTVNSTYSFQLKLPRTGDCFCNGGTSLLGTNTSLDTSSPIVVAIVNNASSLLIQSMPRSGSTIGQGLQYQYYWFVIQGAASVSVSGYGVAY